jgi:hypothetical protein
MKMLTPSQLGSKPNVKRIALPDYDFDRQGRGSTLDMAHTFNSIQTFDSKGHPHDSKNDNTD